MHCLHPWFKKLGESPDLFKHIMVEMGIKFEGDWAVKTSVVKLINELCGTDFKQKRIWQWIYDTRRSWKGEYDFLFPADPEFQAKRSWCHVTEAWCVIALICIRQGCLHRWLYHFNFLDEGGEVGGATQIFFNNPVVVNGFQVEGKGVIKLPER